MAVQIQLRRGTAAEWTAANPTLAVGEVGLETDTGKLKVGTGALAWTALGYGGIAGPTGATGATGSTGPAGATGPAGPAGTTTWAGLTGTPTTLGGYGITDAAPKASPALTGTPTAPTAAADTNTTQLATTAHLQGQKGTAAPLAPGTAAAGTSAKWTPIDHVHPIIGSPAQIGVAVSDETTALTTGTAKLTFRMPYAMTLTSVRASLKTASSSGIPAINVKENGVTIFSTTLTINSGAKTSVGATTPVVISDSALADDAEMTVDIDTAGTGAIGLKLWFIGVRA